MSGLNLLAPLGLLALIGLPVVVLLHMRHTTPREQLVPTLRFWLAVAPEQTDRSRFKRPPLSLLLLLQLLIVALLAFGLTRPASSETLGGLNLRTEPQHLIVVLDGSTSMAAVDEANGPTRFERARALALERIGDLREGDVATVLLLGTRTTTYEATDAGGFATLRDRLAGIALPGGRADLSASLRLAHDLLLPRMADRVLVISDGALPVDPGVVADLGASVDLLQVGDATAANVAVTDLAASADPTAPMVQRLLVRVRNFEEQPVTAPVVITVDGLEFARREVTIPELGGETELVWELPADATNVVAAIDVLDALAADNSASLILHQADELALNILLVSDAPTFLQRALAVLPGAQVTTEPTGGSGAAEVRQAYDLVVYDGFAPPVEELPAAPLLFVHPPTESGPFVSTGIMPDPAVGPVQPNDPLLYGVDLGGVSFGPTPIYEFDVSFSEVIGAVDRTGAARGPILVRGTLAGQPTIALASDLAQSNLPRRVAFPILIANIAAELAPSPFPASLPLGDPFTYRVGADAAAVRVSPPIGDPVTLPLPATMASAADPAPAGSDAAANAPAETAREVTFTDTGQPGLYQVNELDAAGTSLSDGRFVVNAGHPQESDLRPNPDLPTVLATARPTTDLAANADLSDFWPLLVLAALAILALEWLVALFRRRPRLSFGPPTARPTNT